MCKMLEDMRIEAAKEAAKEADRKTAVRMIKKGRMSLEEITDYVPSLSMKELEDIEAEVMQLA